MTNLFIEKLLQFLSNLPNGADEKVITENFLSVSKIDIAAALNELLSQNKIEVSVKAEGVYYKVKKVEQQNYENMILKHIKESGSQGIWLKDLKTKTHIPQTLLSKMLKSLETTNVIKSLKSIKNYKKIYVMFDECPDEEMTGGIWYDNNAIDSSFIENMFEIIYKLLTKKTPIKENILPNINDLLSLTELESLISKSNLVEFKIKSVDILTIINIMDADGLLEIVEYNDKKLLRPLNKSFYFEKFIRKD